MAQAVDRELPAGTRPGAARTTATIERFPAVGERVGAAPAGKGGTFRSLRHRNYRLLWIGTLFSSSGLWLQQVTLNYLAFALTGSSMVVGLASGARSLPLLALGPVGGVMADRYDKKRLMMSTQLAQLLLTFIFAVVIVSGHLEVWHLFVFSLLSGAAWALNMPVRQSIVPSLVPREDLMNAMALNSAGFNITRILGPALAGLMIAKIGPGENFFIQSAAYVGVAITVAQLALPASSRSTGKGGGSAYANLKEGAAYVWGNATLRIQMLLALVPVVIALPYIAILPQFNDEVLGGSPGTFGLMMAAPGVGAVVATLIVASRRDIVRHGLLLLAALFALGLSLISLAFARNILVVLSMLVLVGATQMIYMTTSQTVVQLAIPDEYRGRVMGIYMLNQGMLPLGALFAGSLADVYSASTALVVMGALVAALAVLFYARAGSVRRLVGEARTSY